MVDELERAASYYPVSTNGVTPPPGVPADRSSYLRHLPGMYQESEFLGRFLLIFEHVLSPVHRTVANLPTYFDPAITPEELLGWLGAWLGIVIDPRWPESRRRDLLAHGSALYAWRGTRRGLSEFIRLYTGVAPEIIEPSIDDLRAGRAQPFTFSITLRLPDPSAVDERLLRDVIDVEKPAWAAYTLRIERASDMIGS